MTALDYLILDGLKHVVDLIYSSIGSTIFDCFAHVNSLISSNKHIKNLKFENVRVNLLGYESLKTTQLMNVDTLSFIGSKIANYDQFKHININKIPNVEYSDYNMLSRFGSLYNEIVKNVTFTEEITEIIIEKSITFKSNSYNESETLSNDHEEVHIKSETSFTLGIEDTTGITTKVILELTKPEQTITLPTNEFSSGFSLGIVINENGAGLNLPNSNVIPIDVSGNGELNVKPKDKSNEISFTKSFDVLGDMKVNVPETVKNIYVKLLNMFGKSSLSAKKSKLLSEEEEEETQKIVIEELNINNESMTTINDAIVNIMKINSNANVIFEGDTMFIGNILIKYNDDEQNQNNAIIKLNGEKFEFNSTEFILRPNSENKLEEFVVIEGNANVFTLDKCKEIAEIVIDEDDYYEMICNAEKGITKMKAQKKSEVEEKGLSLTQSIIVIVCVVVVIVIVIIVIVIVKKKTHKDKEDMYEVDNLYLSDMSEEDRNEEKF
ncbi:hypothetical protein GPJ56_005893 [Histomonas meleagridis]|uniref:uncharacterized protein n=1 Tax=Histomonas meleagridis TaxID=135588 RepID=UPI00355A26AF|nr:hypothetical protein GPJ56_005893 [Histomonas meleagridis]KAH0801909.1 hypothetical protein GO595_005327 [Histomonas meleagridis]